MNLIEKVKSKLEKELELSNIEVIDDSHRHAKHQQAIEHGGKHLTIKLESDEKFKQLSKVQQHRRIYSILAAEMSHEIHALCIKIS